MLFTQACRPTCVETTATIDSLLYYQTRSTNIYFLHSRQPSQLFEHWSIAILMQLENSPSTQFQITLQRFAR